MKIFIKIILIVLIVLFAFYNYKFISFDKGISKRNMEAKYVSEFLQTLSNIKSVQYYKKTIPPQGDPGTGRRPSNLQPYDYIYRVYIVTTQDAYLLDATQDDIDAFSVLGIFSSKLQPELIKPIPFYVEVIIAIIVLAIPFGRKKKEEN